MARQAALSGRTTALNTAHCSSGGRYRTSTASTISVPSVFFQSLKRFRLSHGITPSVSDGGARGGMRLKANAALIERTRSPFLDQRTAVVEIHDQRRDERHGEIRE